MKSMKCTKSVKKHIKKIRDAIKHQAKSSTCKTSKKFAKTVRKNIFKSTGAVYIRTSSKTNQHGASIARQKEASQRTAAQQQTEIVIGQA